MSSYEESSKGKSIDIKVKFRKILEEYEDYAFNDTADEGFVDEIFYKLKELHCTTTEDHEWIYDMCGYWQHQYCDWCHKAKYPDLNSKKCSQLDEEMKGMTEEEYLSTF